jgi:hypothetical protein
VIWDNRRVLHRGRPWRDLEHRRVMRRTTVAGAGPTAVDGKPVVERGVPCELALQPVEAGGRVVEHRAAV